MDNIDWQHTGIMLLAKQLLGMRAPTGIITALAWLLLWLSLLCYTAASGYELRFPISMTIGLLIEIIIGIGGSYFILLDASGLFH